MNKFEEKFEKSFKHLGTELVKTRENEVAIEYVMVDKIMGVVGLVSISKEDFKPFNSQLLFGSNVVMVKSWLRVLE